MKFTFSWLKEHLDTTATLDEVCSTLTSIGLEVEKVEDKGKSLSYFSVAHILEAKPHENSTKLKICQVKTIDSVTPLQIICGAANARTGLKVAYAPIGAIIPTNQMLIKKAKIAGVESNGMLCSARELGLGEDSEGIIEIDESCAIGKKITELYGLNDAVIEINVTPNRGDCLGIRGIARDLAAAGIGKLKPLEIRKPNSQFSSAIQIKNEAITLEGCSFAAFRHIKNVKNCQSPKWLKDQLSSIGMNSISAIVDVTNFVMMVLNRPMHAYDASKINGSLIIRFANNDEKFTSLKKEDFILDEKILVISDEEKPLGIAGVIGASNSSCDLETTEILLESAFFNPSAIAYSGRKLNILSDARYRFERGVDVNSCVDGIELATQLITEICGGKISEIKITEGEKALVKKIEFDLSKIKKLIGVEVPKDKVKQIFVDLNFGLEEISENKFFVYPSSNRHDISASEDLVEEVIRIFGYDKITPQKLENSEIKNTNNQARQAKLLLATKGMTETINWSFCDANLVDLFATKNEQLILANPISAELNHMRPTLAIGLLESYKRNYLRGFADLSLFEMGKIFSDTSEKGQKMMISGIRAGKNKEQNHYNDQRDFDVFDVKKDLLEVIEIFGIRADSLQISNSEVAKYYHPHRCAALKLGKNIIGYFGEIHPKITKAFGIKTRVNAFEIFVDNLPNQQKAISRKAFTINDLQPVERDFAFLINKSDTINELTRTVQNCDKQLIKQVNIFDIYTGKNIAVDKKSVALRVVIQPIEKTFTSEEIDNISKKIIDTVCRAHQAILRDAT